MPDHVKKKEDAVRSRTRISAFLTALVVSLGLLVAGPASPANAGTLTLSGTVSLGSTATPAGAGEVTVFYRTSAQALDPSRSVVTDAAGAYSITNLDAGSYYLYFDYSGAGTYQDAWYNELAAISTPAAFVYLTASRAGINTTLTVPVTLQGTVTLGAAGDVPAAGEVLVSYIYQTGAGQSAESTPVPVAAGGTYSIPGLSRGSYKLHFTYAGSGAYQSAWAGLPASTNYFAEDSFSITLNSPVVTKNFVQPSTVLIAGTVSLGSTATPAGAGAVGVSLEYYHRPTLTWLPLSATTSTDASGSYSIGGLNTVALRVTFSYLGGDGRYKQTTVIGGHNTYFPGTGRNVTIASTYRIAGSVYLGDTSVLAGAGEVRIDADGPGETITALTDSAGAFSLGDLVGGGYVITYTYLGSGPYKTLRTPASGWTTLSADQLALAPVLPKVNVLSGTVLDEEGNPLQGITVFAQGIRAVPLNYNYAMDFTTTTDADGNYRFNDVPDGHLSVRFSGSAGGIDYATMEWDGSYPGLGERIYLAGGGVTGDIDAVMPEEGTILVTIDAPELDPTDYGLYVNADLYLFDFSSGEWVQSTGQVIGGPTSEIDFGRLYPGFYFVNVVYDGPLGYDSVESDVFTVLPGDEYEFEAKVTPNERMDCQAAPGLPVACRIGGASRFNVSATISEVGFDAGVPVVYIANGLNYPDALSAAPAASYQGGPLLLVEPTLIPAPILAEIQRLEPDKIVVVGGPGSVSPAVYNQLSTLAPDITRLGGIDRFAASRAVAEYAFGHDGATDAYIATGNGFPDALSAGGAASALGAPVITVDGLASSVDAETRDLLIALGVTTVRIAGGPGSVTPALAASIDAIPGIDVIRLSGATRYEASGAINRDVFESAPVVFLAVGTNYPDALSGGALAGAFGAPLYVIPADCIPSYVLEDIQYVGAGAVIVLGGPGSVYGSVLDFQQCA